MAKPQLENGYTQIANEILDKLAKLHLSPNQWQIVIFIIRKTYGYKKKVDYIANSQIVQGTDLCKAVVSRALRSLNDMNLLSRNGKLIGFQKDWEHWSKLAESSTLSLKLAIPSTKVSNSAEQLAIPSTKVSSCAVTQKKKDNITKNTIQKKQYGEFINVFLTDQEHRKLLARFGQDKAQGLIEMLSAGIESKSYKYESHYAAILSWERREERPGRDGSDPNRYIGQKHGQMIRRGEKDDPDKYIKGKYGHIVRR